MGYFKRFIVFDLETGGLKGKIHAITEVAMIAYDGDTLEEVDRIEGLIAPYDAVYTTEAAEVSGISYELLEEEGLPIDGFFNVMLDFLEDNKVNGRKPVPVGHNIKKFDLGFLDEQMFKRFDKKIDRYFNIKDAVDTLDWARYKFTSSGKFDLSSSCANIGVTIEKAHRAMPDVEANGKLFIDFMKSLRGGILDESDEEDIIVERGSFYL